MFLYDNVCMLYSAVERELGVLCENLLFCAVPWEESWMFLCDNVCFVQCRGTRAGCICVILYMLC